MTDLRGERDGHALLTIRQAWAVLSRRLGSRSPAWETFRTWVRPSFQSGDRPGRAKMIPRPVRVGGRVYFRRRDIERLADGLAAARERERRRGE